MPQIPRRRILAFTLVELMVVILIIGVLIGILVPVVTSIKKKAQAADSLAQLNALRGAIEAYQQTYGAYPGPLQDAMMFQVPPGTPPLPNGIAPNPDHSNGCRVTQSENLVLGLMGGLSFQNGAVVYNYTDVGTGPRSLNPANPGQNPPFYNNTKELTKFDSQGRACFSDGVNGAGQPVGACFDSGIPEFVDKFAEPLPILYLRARKGAPGVISDQKFWGADGTPGNPFFQYDVRQYYAYIADITTEPPRSGIRLYGAMQGWPPTTGATGFFDLASTDGAAHNIGYDPMLPAGDPNQGQGDPLNTDKGHPNFAAAYFRHPTVNSPPKTAMNNTGTPRSKDQWILISAGPDRVYGTADDITTFGSVIP